jgi:hypothetical protein
MEDHYKRIEILGAKQISEAQIPEAEENRND